jgi:hypothetical protein
MVVAAAGSKTEKTIAVSLFREKDVSCRGMEARGTMGSEDGV